MDIGKTSSSSVQVFFLAVFLAAATATPTSAAEVLIEGFEKTEGLKTSGNWSRTSGVIAGNSSRPLSTISAAT